MTLRWLIMLCLLVPTAGCMGDNIVDPAMPIEDHRLLVLPFRDPLFDRYDSRVGIALAQQLSTVLQARHNNDTDDAIETVAFNAFTNAVRDVDPRTLSHAQLAARVKADRVLVGELTTYSTRNKTDIAILRGKATVRLDVLDGKTEATLFSHEFSVAYPPDDLYSMGMVPTTEGGEAQIERGLVREIARSVADLFSYHEPKSRRR